MGEPPELLEFPLRVRSTDLTDLVQQDLKRLKTERQQLDHERDQYAEMRKAVAEVHFKDPIVLDVGGKRFKTTLATLRRDKNSMIAAMFSGSGFPMQPSDDGSFFIDRDGTHFRFILNFLRGCFTTIGLDKATVDQLAVEADFYQLKLMYDLLCPSFLRLAPDTVGNGLIFHLGGSDSSGWTNPVLSGRIEVSGGFQSLTDMVGRSAISTTGSCNSAINKHIELCLVSAKLRPSHYSLAWNGATCHQGATWEVAGCESADSTCPWVTFAFSAIDGSSLPANSSMKPVLFAVTNGSQTFYKKLKLTCVGRDSAAGGNCKCFHIGQLEFYGELDLRV